MIDRLQSVLRGDARVAYALLFGSAAKGRLHARSDVDVAVAPAGHRFTTRELGELTARLESAAGRAVHLVLLDEAPPGLAYRMFRDGLPLMVSDQRAMNDRLARAILEYFDFRPVEEMLTRGALRARQVDKTVLAAKVAAVRGAVTRIRAVLPPTSGAFLADSN